MSHAGRFKVEIEGTVVAVVPQMAYAQDFLPDGMSIKKSTYSRSSIDRAMVAIDKYKGEHINTCVVRLPRVTKVQPVQEQTAAEEEAS
jgi:hypothetical protein